MCLAVPARIVSIINDIHAWVEIMDVRQKVNIQLINSPVQGEYVLIHAGFAIEKIDLEYFDFLNDTLYEMLDDTGEKENRAAQELKDACAEGYEAYEKGKAADHEE